jgi:hypothetical protein
VIVRLNGLGIASWSSLMLLAGSLIGFAGSAVTRRPVSPTSVASQTDTSPESPLPREWPTSDSPLPREWRSTTAGFEGMIRERTE